jgi:hypothetical protein
MATKYAFSVTAWNSTGQSVHSNCFVLRTPQIPSAPTGLSVTSFTKTSVSLSWTNPGGGGLVNDTVYYTVGAACSGAMTAQSTMGAATTATLANLTTGTEYAMEVSAWNATQSPASSCVVKTTSQVPAAPTSLTSNAITTSSVALAWISPGGGNLLNLTIYWAAGDSCAGTLLAHSLRPTGPGYTAYMATGLATGTEYAFAVTAWNATGQSPASNCYVRTTAQVPSAPTGLATTASTTTTISLSWSNPAGGGLTADTVYYLAGTTCTASMSSYPISGAATSATLTGLTAGTGYAIDVSAWNATGQSVPSSCYTATTAALPSSSTSSSCGPSCWLAQPVVLLGLVAAIVVVVAVVFLLLRGRSRRGPRAEPPEAPRPPESPPPPPDGEAPVSEEPPPS